MDKDDIYQCPFDAPADPPWSPRIVPASLIGIVVLFFLVMAYYYDFDSQTAQYDYVDVEHNSTKTVTTSPVIEQPASEQAPDFSAAIRDAANSLVMRILMEQGFASARITGSRWEFLCAVREDGKPAEQWRIYATFQAADVPHVDRSLICDVLIIDGRVEDLQQWRSRQLPSPLAQPLPSTQ